MNILFFGGHYWDKGPWFRKQQFASRLVDRGHKVFYVESTISVIKKKKGDNFPLFKSKFRKVTDNLIIISPSTLFPFPNNYYSRHLYNLKVIWEIKRYFKKENINEFIIWFNQIQFSSVIRLFSKTIIFDLADDTPFYSILANDTKGFHTMFKYVKNAFSISDINIVSAQKIKEKYQCFSKSEILVIPNGHSIKIADNHSYDVPGEMKSIKSPIIGFVGTMFRFIDDQLLQFLIKNRPNYNFVFIGPVQDNFPIHKIKNYSNVFLLGEKSKSDIPAYIKSFDICLNPFKVHEVNDSVSPVKVFEYLALKKIVISTEMYSLKKEVISNHIIFASDYSDFLQKLDFCLCNNLTANNINDSILNDYNWDQLFCKLIKSIDNRVIL